MRIILESGVFSSAHVITYILEINFKMVANDLAYIDTERCYVVAAK